MTDEKSKRACRFVDGSGNPLFTVSDGERLLLTEFNDNRTAFICHYIDDEHMRIGEAVWETHRFAAVQEQRGVLYWPEHPKENAPCDFYTVYQIRNVGKAAYSFMPYAEAKDMFDPSHYERVYRGMLAHLTTLDELRRKHLANDRPFRERMRPLSVSDVVVLRRSGKEQTYYVDAEGFHEIALPTYPAQRGRNRSRQER